MVKVQKQRFNSQNCTHTQNSLLSSSFHEFKQHASNVSSQIILFMTFHSNVIANRWWKHFSSRSRMKRKCLPLLHCWKKMKCLLLMNRTTSFFFVSTSQSVVLISITQLFSMQCFLLVLRHEQILSLLISISALIVSKIKSWIASNCKGVVSQSCSTSMTLSTSLSTFHPSPPSPSLENYLR